MRSFFQNIFMTSNPSLNPTPVKFEQLSTEFFAPRNSFVTTTARELGQFKRRTQRELQSTFCTTLHLSLHEHILPELPSFNKIFASAWLDERTVVTGTKDNKLLLWDVDRPALERVEVPPSSTWRQENPTENTSSSGIHCISKSQDSELLAAGGQHPADCAVFQITPDGLKPKFVFEGHDDWIFGCAFATPNRLITVSRDHTIQLWDTSLDQCSTSHGHGHHHESQSEEMDTTQSRRPSDSDMSLADHNRSDVEFGNFGEHNAGWSCMSDHDSASDWSADLSEQRWSCGGSDQDDEWAVTSGLVAALSRSDGWVGRYGSGEGIIYVHEPMERREEHTGRVRDVRFYDKEKRFVSLSSDKTAKVWDFETFSVISTVSLEYNMDLVALAHHTDHPLVAIGSSSHISLLDTREEQCMSHINSLDNGTGVRSLSFQNHVVTIGGGAGRISFFDMRAQRYLPVCQEETNAGSSPLYLQTSNGHVQQDSLFTDIFGPDAHVPQTVYTHCYDDSMSRLFVGGGPLPVCLQGSYAAVW